MLTAYEVNSLAFVGECFRILCAWNMFVAMHDRLSGAANRAAHIKALLLFCAGSVPNPPWASKSIARSPTYSHNYSTVIMKMVWGTNDTLDPPCTTL